METMLPRDASVWAKEKMQDAQDRVCLEDYEAYQALYELWLRRESE